MGPQEHIPKHMRYFQQQIDVQQQEIAMQDQRINQMEETITQEQPVQEQLDAGALPVPETAGNPAVARVGDMGDMVGGSSPSSSAMPPVNPETPGQQVLSEDDLLTI